MGQWALDGEAHREVVALLHHGRAAFGQLGAECLGFGGRRLWLYSLWLYFIWRCLLWLLHLHPLALLLAEDAQVGEAARHLVSG